MALKSARTAFVGRTLRGPVDRPVLVASFAEFQHAFGGLWQPSPLGYAVEHFFDNGGTEAVVVRVVNGARAACLSLAVAVTAGESAQPLTLRALRPGTREFLRASVDYDNIAEDASAEFNLTLQRVTMQSGGKVEDQEIFRRLCTLPDSPRHPSKVLPRSQLAKLEGCVPPGRPLRTLDPHSGLATGYVAADSSGDDGGPLTDYDVIGSQLKHTGLFALDGIDGFNLLCVPPLSRERDVGAAVLLVAARYCRSRRALLVVDPPVDWHTAEDALAGLRHLNFASEDAVMYFPRVLAYDKLRGRFESFAPCGAVAGMLARSEATHPVWGPPRPEDAVLRPGFRPSCLVPEDRRLRLAGAGVNTLQAVRSAARADLQPRTMACRSTNPADAQTLAARRLLLFILNSVDRGTRWMAGRTPHPRTAALAVAQVRAFFARVHAAGAFGTLAVEEAFFVSCAMRPEGPGLQLVIGFAGFRGADFYTYRVSPALPGDGQAAPATFSRLSISPASEFVRRGGVEATASLGSAGSVASISLAKA